jgi:hypothetical protein
VSATDDAKVRVQEVMARAHAWSDKARATSAAICDDPVLCVFDFIHFMLLSVRRTEYI